MADGNRQWVITAYALAFGGLLHPCAGVPHRRHFPALMSRNRRQFPVSTGAFKYGHLMLCRGLKEVFSDEPSTAGVDLEPVSYLPNRITGSALIGSILKRHGS
ncbi:hypothetical protein [Streptomyces olivochromogenes]|uniref:hypothetical protein n=1 Tax=Streptomyces olivochromogenes TaxID=1963 RepID=UPI0036964A8D